jgi:predicted acetyltransferase
VPSFDHDYELRRFAPEIVDGAATPATAGWVAAERLAFHETHHDDPETVAAEARRMITDDRELTGVYARETCPGTLGADQPVGTFVSFTKTLNVGGGRLLDAHLISDVTVRPTHRRRGILRRMMTGDLHRAAERGAAVAALTATEATIYRRFGFGPATRQRTISMSKREPLKLLTSSRGTVELADPTTLGPVAEAVFDAFHARTTGSVDRHAGHWSRMLAGVDYGTKADPNLRAALHFSPEGAPDGYVTYRSAERGDDVVLTVVDLVTASDDAYLGLWELLASIDLVTEITWKAAPIDDVLVHALADNRHLTVAREQDHVWLRILDPVAALEARPYAADATVTLRVHDRLGLADGTFRLTASGGDGTVERMVGPDGDPADGADVELDASVLASCYLGGTDVVTLAAAGLLHEHAPGAVQRLRTLLTPERSVYGVTSF